MQESGPFVYRKKTPGLRARFADFRTESKGPGDGDPNSGAALYRIRSGGISGAVRRNSDQPILRRRFGRKNRGLGDRLTPGRPFHAAPG